MTRATTQRRRRTGVDLDGYGVNDPVDVMREVQDVFQEMRAGYDAGRDTQFTPKLIDIPTAGANADWHIRNPSAYLKIIERSRDLQRNNPLIGQALKRLVYNILLTGPTLAPDTGDTDFDAEIVDHMTSIADDPYQFDAKGMHTLNGMAKLLLSQTWTDGDILPVGLPDGTVNPIEGHRPRTPNRLKARDVVHGCRVNSYGRPIEWWVTKSDIGTDGAATVKLADIERLPAFVEDEFGTFPNVWHVVDPIRVSQTRGVSAMAPVHDYVRFFDDIQLAELYKRQLASYFVFLRESLPTQAYGNAGQVAALGAQTTEKQEDGRQRTNDRVAPGTELRVDGAREKVTAWQPSVQTEGAEKQAALVLSIIAINLGMPPMMFMLDPNSNFSGHRGAMNQARMGFEHQMGMITQRFYSPWYCWQLRRWARQKPERMRMFEKLGRVAFFRHRWNPPAYPYLEPMTDQAALHYEMQAGLSSPRRVLAKRSLDVDIVNDERVADNGSLIAKAIDQAAKINADLPAGQPPVTWRDILNPGPTTQFIVKSDPAGATATQGDPQPGGKPNGQ